MAKGSWQTSPVLGSLMDFMTCLPCFFVARLRKRTKRSPLPPPTDNEHGLGLHELRVGQCCEVAAGFHKELRKRPDLRPQKGPATFAYV